MWIQSLRKLHLTSPDRLRREFAPVLFEFNLHQPSPTLRRGVLRRRRVAVARRVVWFNLLKVRLDAQFRFEPRRARVRRRGRVWECSLRRRRVRRVRGRARARRRVVAFVDAHDANIIALVVGVARRRDLARTQVAIVVARHASPPRRVRWGRGRRARRATMCEARRSCRDLKTARRRAGRCSCIQFSSMSMMTLPTARRERKRASASRTPSFVNGKRLPTRGFKSPASYMSRK